ncbi:MAG: tail fiber domain-containing protein [Chitinophaga sp.]|uniref:tail fiber domain-containing protein n=1 Tax=Chitinophaga sp. TaxID=1869181 RepID=UPI0025C02D03|nr:tail fiber domain-containing protein [Chitinophaga sp.]MBV8256166.1 tail fiber domain-containing protein [Chitinophaga sp.]
MKLFFSTVAALCLTTTVFAQKIYQIRADSVRIYNVCDTAELIIENRTKDSIGYLFNKGAGRTEFRRIRLQKVGNTKIAIIGQDTLDLATIPGIVGNGNDYIKNQEAVDQYAAFRINGKGILGVLEVNDGLPDPDTRNYAPFGVTRPSTVQGNLAYIAMTRYSQKVWQLGISDANNFIIGSPTGYGTRMMYPALSITPLGNVMIGENYSLTEKLNVGGNASFGRPGITGFTKLEEGVAPATGSLGFYTTDGIRRGYINFGNNNINYVLEDTSAGKTNSHAFYGRLTMANHKNYKALATNQYGEVVEGANNFILNKFSDTPMEGNFNISGIARSAAAEVGDAEILYDTFWYSPFGVTRAKGGDRAYISMTQAGILNWALGINNDGELIMGPSKSSDATLRREMYPRVHINMVGDIMAQGNVQATSFFQTSMRSLKKDIQPIPYSALTVLNKTQVRTFRFKADTTNKINVGFIADEVPEEIATPGRKGVDQASTVGLLVRAVQELSTKNEQLENENKKLNSTLAEVLKRLESLENKK